MKERKVLVLVSVVLVLLVALAGIAVSSSPNFSVMVQSERPVGRHLFGDWYVVGISAESEDGAVSFAKRIPGVLAAEPDARLQMHQASCPPAEWYIENLGQFGGPDNAGVDTDAREAWGILRATLRSPSSIRIAVADSGVDFCCHPRFRDVKIYAQKKFAEDGRSVGDIYGHGTAVAGVITAMLPDPSWYKLGSYRVFDEYGYTSYSILVDALDEAVKDGTKIVNFSGGGSKPSEALRAFLVSHPDVLFVFSAGNEASSLPEYPARYDDLPNVVSVAANEQSGALAIWTNTGALLTAPGEYIYTSMAGCQTRPITICQPAGYGFLSGTSFSAPIVSAICAGRSVLHPEESATEVRIKLLSSVKKSSRYDRRIVSGGMANFNAMLREK